jgi:hypothetical protein
MQTSKPKVARVYVRATDPATNRTVSFTVYHATPEQVKDRVSRESKPKPLRPSATSAA